MSETPKFDRARRNALKAVGLIAGSAIAIGIPHKQAAAQSQPNGLGSLLDLLLDLLKGKKPGTGGSSGGGNCFARGTFVRTRVAYRPIETLTVGDEVAVWFGGFAPIKAMVGHTLTRTAGQWDGNPDNLPVVIRRGALGESLPTSDLCVTASHPVYVDGFLMKAGDLVNGSSIHVKAADGQGSLDFFNIELERHDILDVQGASFESLYRVGMDRCAPLLGFDGGRSKLRSHLRSVASLVIDRRQPIDIIRDRLEEHGLSFARAA
ncbi:Hint domain-containing protein [Reyranella sp.]|uniref:Hint domain-containing protein n=1 Tax=Reyranella sp. TaxID=1929291 RepID=UPI003D0DC03F